MRDDTRVVRFFFQDRLRSLLRDFDAALDEGQTSKVLACLASARKGGVKLPRETALRAARLLSTVGVFWEALSLIYAVLAEQPDDTDAAALLRAVQNAVAENAPTGHASSWKEASPELQAREHLTQADRFRDSGVPAEAAKAYALALSFYPDRADWRIQLANMLKDSSQFGDAEIEYRRVILVRPEDADAYLQLGHVLKLAGREEEAAVAYRTAVERQPDNGQARFELLQLGDPADRHREVLQALDRHELTAIFRLADAMASMKGDLDRLLRRVPLASARSVFPPSLHGTYRRIVRAPPAPSLVGPLRMVALFHADAGDPRAFQTRLSGLMAQEFPALQIVAFGSDPDRRRAVEQLGIGDARLTWRACAPSDGLQAETEIAAGLDADVLLLPGPTAMLDPAAAGWFAYALAGDAPVDAAYCDSESGRYGEGRIERFDPVLRSRIDRDALADAVGETLAVRRKALLRWAVSSALGTDNARHRLVVTLAAEASLAHIPLFLACDLPRDPATEAPKVADDSTRVADEERIAVIVPSRDNGGDVRDLVESLIGSARSAERLDIVVVDNGGRDPETLTILARLKAEHKIRILTRDVPFNWSVLNNEAVEATPSGELLVFANDDMRMLTPHWDVEIRRLLARAEVGAVGAKLLYPDGTIQHAGIICGWDGRVEHEGRREPGDSPGPAGRWRTRRSVGAVTGAFLATRRETFAAIGGFDPQLPISYNDVDYCLNARALGLRVMWTPRIVLAHHESKSRGFDHQSAERRARDEAEGRRLRQRWGAALDRDPSINPNWAQVLPPFQAYWLPDVTEIERYVASSAKPEPWHVARDGRLPLA